MAIVISNMLFRIIRIIRRKFSYNTISYYTNSYNA